METQLPQEPTIPNNSNVGPQTKAINFLKANSKFVIPGLAALAIIFIAGAGYFTYKQGLIKLPFQAGQQQAEEPKEKDWASDPSSIIMPKKAYDPALQSGPFRCPLDLSYCSNAKNYKESALVANIALDTEIRAAFDGRVIRFVGSKTLPDGERDEFYFLRLVNKDKGLSGVYMLKGEASNNLDVKEGDVIATSNGEKIISLEGGNFMFAIQKADEAEGSYVSLAKETFK